MSAPTEEAEIERGWFSLLLKTPGCRYLPSVSLSPKFVV